ncbi:MAG: hypothetical protein EA349_10740 [Halomonadaceae bacterium]|nr:MAG: hypothetical protein EA349_10740 [Halomonadaceae bacterium]
MVAVGAAMGRPGTVAVCRAGLLLVTVAGFTAPGGGLPLMILDGFPLELTPLTLIAGLLLLGGTLGFAWNKDMLRRVLAFNLMSSGVFLLLALTLSPENGQTGLLQLLLILFMAVNALLSALVLHLRARLQQLTGVTAVAQEPEQESSS